MFVCPNCGVEMDITEIGEVCINCGIQVPLDLEPPEEDKQEDE